MDDRMDAHGDVQRSTVTVVGAGVVTITAGGGMTVVEWASMPGAGPIRVMVRRGDAPRMVLAADTVMLEAVAAKQAGVAQSLASQETINERLAMLRTGGLNNELQRRGLTKVRIVQPVDGGRWVAVALDGVDTGAWLGAFETGEAAETWALSEDYAVTT